MKTIEELKKERERIFCYGEEIRGRPAFKSECRYLQRKVRDINTCIALLETGSTMASIKKQISLIEKKCAIIAGAGFGMPKKERLAHLKLHNHSGLLKTLKLLNFLISKSW